MLSDFRSLRVELRAALPWLLAGCGVTVASLLIHFSLAHGTPASMARLSPEDLSTFVRLWDGHRAAVNIWHNGVMLNVASFVVASTWLAFFSTDIPSSSKLLLRITAAGSLLALAMIPLSWIPPDRLPAALLVLMPGRYLNFAAMTFVALIFGLLASRRQLWSSFVLLFLTCGLLAGGQSMLWEFLEHHHGIRYQSHVRPLHIVWMATAALLAGAVWKSREQRAMSEEPSHPSHPSHPLHPLHPLTISRTLRQPRVRRERL